MAATLRHKPRRFCQSSVRPCRTKDSEPKYRSASDQQMDVMSPCREGVAWTLVNALASGRPP
eukprot:4398828-Prorocentrum_lima.AAC.1